MSPLLRMSEKNKLVHSLINIPVPFPRFTTNFQMQLTVVNKIAMNQHIFC